MKKKKWLQRTEIICLCALICCILWGSAFPGVKIGYKVWNIHSEQIESQIIFAGIRFALAGILTIILGSIMQKKLLFPRKNEIGNTMKLSVFQTVLQYYFFYTGLAKTSGVNASIITSTNVFLAILVAIFLFRQEKIDLQKIIGCILGFAGVLLINMNSGKINMDMKWSGEGAIFLAAISSAISSSLIKKYSKDNDTVVLSAYQFLFGGVTLVFIGKIMGGSLEYMGMKAMIILIYLGFVSAIAYTLWGILLKYNPVSKVAVFGFINPIAGVILSGIFLGEKGAFSIITLGALLLVSLGIFTVNLESRQK